MERYKNVKPNMIKQARIERAIGYFLSVPCVLGAISGIVAISKEQLYPAIGLALISAITGALAKHQFTLAKIIEDPLNIINK